METYRIQTSSKKFHIVSGNYYFTGVYLNSVRGWYYVHNTDDIENLLIEEV